MKDINVQANNKINLVGKLLDVEFGQGTLSDNRPYERATVTVRVTQTYEGKTETSEVPVSIFATQYTSTGKANPAFKNIQDLKTMKTAQNVGIDNADTVRMTGLSLQENNFVSRTGVLINGWQIRGSFINVVKAPEVASFEIQIYVMSMTDEVDRDGELTGRMILKGGIVQYGGKLDVVEFIVDDPDKIDYIQRNWGENKTVTVRGRIRVTSEEVTSAGNSSWGEDIPEEQTTKFVRELIILTGDDVPVDDEFGYNPVEIKKAFNDRKARIEQLQINARQKATKQGAMDANKAGTSNKSYDWE